MENGFSSKSNQKNTKKKNQKRKRRDKRVNSFKTDTQKENLPNEKQYDKNIRPKVLLKSSCEFEIKRGSGSELEDIQTPNIDYYGINEICACGDPKRDFDGEWEDLGTFSNIDLENIAEQVQQIQTESVTSNDTTLLMTEDQGTVPENTIVEIQGFEIGYLRDEDNRLIEESNDNVTDGEVYNFLIEEDTISDENYIMCVNKCFEDLNDLYLIEESRCGAPFSDVIKETDTMESEMEDDTGLFTLVCTDENLKEETLFIPHVMLEVSNVPTIQKSLSLKKRPSEISFKQSATSITDVTSISEDNLPLKVENDCKPAKKKKANIYQLFFKKFLKEKSPNKEIRGCKEVKKEIFARTISLGSEDCIKYDDQSLKSINEFENVCTEIDKEIPKVENCIKDDDQSLKSVKEIESVYAEIDKEIPKVETNIDSKNVSNKRRFKNLWKKKVKTKNEVKETFTDISEMIEKPDDVEACQLNESVNNDDDPLISMDGHCAQKIDDDHLFPDAITATKIVGSTMADIPFIDDLQVSISDDVAIYNGESKRPRSISKFFVPMASMESLYIPNESIKGDNILKSLISQSPFRKKRVIGNILGCISKGR